jgi:hypothetical protein
LIWVVAQNALLLSFNLPLSLSLGDARAATLRLVFDRLWATPAASFPHRAQRVALPRVQTWLLALGVLFGLISVFVWVCWRRLRALGSGSPLARFGAARLLRDRGLVAQRTWARALDLQRLWIAGPISGRPFLGWIGRAPARMLAAEREPVSQASHSRRGSASETVSISEQRVTGAPWLRQVDSENALLIYRDLPPAVVRAPRRFADPRFERYRRSLNRSV